MEALELRRANASLERQLRAEREGWRRRGEEEGAERQARERLIEDMRRDVADMRRDIEAGGAGKGGRSEAEVRAEWEEAMAALVGEAEERERAHERKLRERSAEVERLRLDVAREVGRAEAAERRVVEAEAQRAADVGEWRTRVELLQRSMEEGMARCMERTAVSEAHLTRLTLSLSSLTTRTRERQAALQSKVSSLTALLAQQTALHGHSLASLHTQHTAALDALRVERDAQSAVYAGEVERLCTELERMENEREEREELITGFLQHYHTHPPPPPLSPPSPYPTPSAVGPTTPCRVKADELRGQMVAMEGEVSALRADLQRRLEREGGLRMLMREMGRREEEGEREVEGLRVALREVREQQRTLRDGWGRQLDMSGEGEGVEGERREGGEEKENLQPNRRAGLAVWESPFRRGKFAWQGSPVRTPGRGG